MMKKTTFKRLAWLLLVLMLALPMLFSCDDEQEPTPVVSDDTVGAVTLTVYTQPGELFTTLQVTNGVQALSSLPTRFGYTLTGF